MSALNFIDRFSTTLASGYTAGGSSLSLSSTTGLPSGACNFYLIVKAEGANTEEVFNVTNVAGTLTVTGAQAGTSASNHGAGAIVTASIMTASAFTQMIANINQIGAYASLPSSGMKQGDTYTTNDGSGYSFVYDGSAWNAFFRGLPVTTPPANSNFSWVNQGSCTVTDPMYISCPGTASSTDTHHLLVKTAPSTPYTITIGMAYDTYPSNYMWCGLCLRDSSSGKIIDFGYLADSGSYKVLATKYPGPTSPSAGDYLRNIDFAYAPIGKFYRIEDDGTNRFYYTSRDGQKWIQVLTTSNTDYLTANQVGIFVAHNLNLATTLTICNVQFFHMSGF